MENSKQMPITGSKEYDPEAPSIIPWVQPKWKRSVTKSDDVQPVLLKETTTDTCGVCRQHESRYTCPRCDMAYCSVACYKKHDASGTSCTESFYRDRVSTVLHLESKEQARSMNKIISRSHQIMNEEGECDEQEIPEDELMRLAEALEGGTIKDEDVDRLLTPEMRMSLERAIKSGELNGIVQPWHPWWMPDFSTVDDEEAVKVRPTLDERLLKVPHFNLLRPGVPLPSLTYNVVDLLYSIALTLRLYHGAENAIAVSEQASTTFVKTSAVLRDDSRHSSVAEALMACTTSSGGGNGHWTILARDVVYLCGSSRHLSHALLDATDILKAETKFMKEQNDTKNASKLRRMKKKLDFYLSWSREATLPSELENQIKTWIKDWKIDPESDSLWLPGTGYERQRAPIATGSLVTEESIKKRI